MCTHDTIMKEEDTGNGLKLDDDTIIGGGLADTCVAYINIFKLYDKKLKN